MPAEISQWVARALRRSGLSQTALAEALSKELRAQIDRSKVNKIVLGKRELSAEEMIAVSKITGAPLPVPSTLAPPVRVVGSIQDGGSVATIQGWEAGAALALFVCPVQLVGRDVIALEVVRDGLAPFYDENDVVFLECPSGGVDDAILGSPAMVCMGSGACYLRAPQRGTEPGLYHLQALTPRAESVWDAEVKWAAKVLLILPLAMLDLVETPAV